MINKKYLLLVTLFISGTSYSQLLGIRNIVVTPDKVRSWTAADGIFDPNIPNGIHMRIIDSIGGFFAVSYLKENKLHGDRLSFDPILNLLLEKGHYVDGKEDGTFYYWDKQGKLTKTERWKAGKLLNTIHYKTSIVSVLHSKKKR